MDSLTEMLLAEWAAHRAKKPYTDGDDYAVHVDHLRIAADRWAATDAAYRTLVGARLAEDAIQEAEGTAQNPYRKPELPTPFDLDAKLAEAGMPPFPTIRKEGTDG